MQVNVPESLLHEVKAKLKLARLDESMGAVEWNDLEVGHTKFKQLVEFWRDEYDWRKFEAFVNTFHHFKTSIQVAGFEAMDIHFLHHRSPRVDAIPLLFVHGWYSNTCLVYRPLRLTGHYQARIIFGILKDHTVAHGASARQASFSRRCTIYTRIWVQRISKKAWIWFRTTRRLFC